MTCSTVQLGATAAIICTRGKRPMRCACGAAAQFLCDHELGNGKTCDQPLCCSCTHQPTKGRDLCAKHAGPAPASITCPYCQRQAPQVSGREVYPHRPDLYAKRFYQCAPCDAYCGTHPDGRPLGRLADAQLRRARNFVHEVFDPLWEGAREIYDGWNNRTKNTARIRAYEWLAHQLQIPLEQCRAAYRVIRREQPTPAQIRTWAKARRR